MDTLTCANCGSDDVLRSPVDEITALCLSCGTVLQVIDQREVSRWTNSEYLYGC
jgi:uncharacterized Zn finger protein